MSSYLDFWGKARGSLPGEPATHPAAYHGLDVAAAADALLTANPRILMRFSTLLGTPPENARRCLVALVALHDIGKFSDAFQSMVPEAWPEKVLGSPPISPASRHHTVVGLDLRERLDLPRLLAPALDARNWGHVALAAIWAGIACHHGKPMEGVSDTGDDIPIRGMQLAGIQSALAYAADVTRLLGPYEGLGSVSEGTANTLSWLVAGLTNLADWIGSNRTHFPYCEPTLSLEEYWPRSRKQADAALVSSGLLPAPNTAAPDLATLFPDIAATPSDLQRCHRAF